MTYFVNCKNLKSEGRVSGHRSTAKLPATWEGNFYYGDFCQAVIEMARSSSSRDRRYAKSYADIYEDAIAHLPKSKLIQSSTVSMFKTMIQTVNKELSKPASTETTSRTSRSSKRCGRCQRHNHERQRRNSYSSDSYYSDYS